ncbi:MAG TPA: hypothetical protein VF788_06215 [Pseudonocardiaceae bacterium]
MGSGLSPVAPVYEGASLSGGTSVVWKVRAVVVSGGAQGTTRPTFGSGASPTSAVTPNGEIRTLAGNLPPPAGERSSAWTTDGLPGAGAGWVPAGTGPA